MLDNDQGKGDVDQLVERNVVHRNENHLSDCPIVDDDHFSVLSCLLLQLLLCCR